MDARTRGGSLMWPEQQQQLEPAASAAVADRASYEAELVAYSMCQEFPSSAPAHVLRGDAAAFGCLACTLYLHCAEHCPA